MLDGEILPPDPPVGSNVVDLRPALHDLGVIHVEGEPEPIRPEYPGARLTALLGPAQTYMLPIGNGQHLPEHPACRLIPKLDDDEMRALSEDVLRNGVRVPIVLHGGKLLDGRARYAAARRAGIERIRATDLPITEDPAENKVRLDVLRRHLSTTTRAIIAVRLADMRPGRRTDLEPAAKLREVSLAQACRLAGVSERSGSSVRAIFATGSDYLKRTLEADAIPLAVAAGIAKLPEDDQVAAVDRAKQEARSPRKTSGGDDQHFTPAPPPNAGSGVPPNVRSLEHKKRTKNRTEKSLSIDLADLDSEFESIWTPWPRKVAKAAARKAYSKARAAGATAAEIAAGVERYAAARAGKDHSFTAHLATWLTNQRWLDEPESPTTRPSPTRQRRSLGEIGLAAIERAEQEANR